MAQPRNHKSILEAYYKIIQLESIDGFYIKNSQYIQAIESVFQTIFTANQNNQKYYQLFVDDINQLCQRLIFKIDSKLDCKRYLAQRNNHIKLFEFCAYGLFNVFRHIQYYVNTTKGKNIWSIAIELFAKSYLHFQFDYLMKLVCQYMDQVGQGGSENLQDVQNLIWKIQILGGSHTILKFSKRDEEVLYSWKRNTEQQSTLTIRLVDYIGRYVSEKYIRKAKSMIGKLAINEYINQCQHLLFNEYNTCITLGITFESWEFILGRCQRLFGDGFGSQLLHSQKVGLIALLEQKDTQTIRKLFSLIKNRNIEVSLILSKYIKTKGHELICQLDKCTKKEKINHIFVSLADLKKLIDAILSDSFSDDFNMHRECDLGFKQVFNYNTKIIESMNLYIHENIADIHIFDTICKIFRYIDNVDLYLNIYQRYLCIRLLNTNFCLEAETQILMSLKKEVGTIPLNKHTNMLLDLKNPCFTFDSGILKVKVLTAGIWPISSKNYGCSIHNGIRELMNTCQQQFSNKFPNRKLNWIFRFGTALINIKVQSGQYRLLVGSLQLLILMRISQVRSLAEIYQQLKSLVEVSEIERNINHFIKLKILVQDTKQIYFNQDLQCKSKSIKCLLNQHINNRQELQQLQKQRDLVIDTLLARIVKISKTIQFAQLCKKVKLMCKSFEVEVWKIKERIEHLIELDLMKRNQNNPSLIFYCP